MSNPIDKIKDRIYGKGKTEYTDFTSLLEVARGFGCLGEIIGREFEVKDDSGKIIYTIRQKPISVSQSRVLLKGMSLLMRMDNEKEAAKWGKGKGKMGGRR